MGKVKNTHLTLNNKYDILADLAAKVDRSVICKNYNTTNSNISKIIKQKDKIEARFQTQSGNSKHARKSDYPMLDKALLEWFSIQRSQNIPINGPLLLEKANQFAAKLKIKLTKEEVSGGYLSRFKKRCNIQFRVISGEAGTVDTRAVDDWIVNTWPKLREGYSDDDIFNADECGLFYKMLPNKTFEFKGKKCTGGKLPKQRITVLVCANATGSVKVKPLVIGKYANPRCFKGIKKNNLPVQYTANSKAWMTSEIFARHITKWDKGLKTSGRKILLLLDNCPAHPPRIPNLTNIKLAFLPPNTTSVIQPMDAGVIKNLKHHYRKILLGKYIFALDNKQELDVNMKEATLILAQAWKLVKQETIHNCFLKARITVPGSNSGILNIEPDVTEEKPIFEHLFPEGVTMDEYVSMDDDLVVFETPTDDEIVEAIQDLESPQVESEEEFDVEEPQPQPITASEAVRSIGILRDYLLTYMDSPEASGEACSALADMESFINRKRLTLMTQMRITSYFESAPNLTVV